MQVTEKQLIDILSKLPRPEKCKYCAFDPTYTGKNCSVYNVCECGIKEFLNFDTKSFNGCLRKFKKLKNKERKIPNES